MSPPDFNMSYRRDLLLDRNADWISGVLVVRAGRGVKIAGHAVRMIDNNTVEIITKKGKP